KMKTRFQAASSVLLLLGKTLDVIEFQPRGLSENHPRFYAKRSVDSAKSVFPHRPQTVFDLRQITVPGPLFRAKTSYPIPCQFHVSSHRGVKPESSLRDASMHARSQMHE